MKKVKLLICDNAWAHAKSSSGDNESKYIDWIRDFDYQGDNDLVFFTDQNLFNFYKVKSKIKIGWLIEPVSTFPYSYSFVKENYMKNGFFDYILTYDKELIKLNENLDKEFFIFYPHSGSWIDKEDFKIYKKIRDVSIIASTKSQTSGHRIRAAVIQYKGSQMDIFGRGRENELKYKLDGLKDYRYSVIIENIKQDDYFTEKIIDAFSCGVVPLYFGTDNIGNYFDERGIIKFNEISELGYVLENICSEKDYLSRMDAIKYNLNESYKYRVSEDWIWENWLKDKYSEFINK